MHNFGENRMEKLHICLSGVGVYENMIDLLDLSIDVFIGLESAGRY